METAIQTKTRRELGKEETQVKYKEMMEYIRDFLSDAPPEGKIFNAKVHFKEKAVNNILFTILCRVGFLTMVKREYYVCNHLGEINLDFAKMIYDAMIEYQNKSNERNKLKKTTPELRDDMHEIERTFDDPDETSHVVADTINQTQSKSIQEIKDSEVNFELLKDYNDFCKFTYNRFICKKLSKESALYAFNEKFDAVCEELLVVKSKKQNLDEKEHENRAKIDADKDKLFTMLNNVVKPETLGNLLAELESNVDETIKPEYDRINSFEKSLTHAIDYLKSYIFLTTSAITEQN